MRSNRSAGVDGRWAASLAWIRSRSFRPLGGLLLGVALVAPRAAEGLDVAVFDNPTHVDTEDLPSSESDTVQAAITALGHSVSTFTDASDSGFTAALAGKDVLVIPEIEFAQLVLSPAAAAVVTNFVAAASW